IENPIWDKWIDHPDYDAYWQAMIPFGAEFSRIKIPVLTTTGYYDGGEIGALYYFAQHRKWLASAEHYLVVGPYNHISGQRGTIEPTVNLADRSDANRVAPGGNILDRVIDTWLGLEFVSAPFANVTEVSGLFSGTLRFVTNKKDFDFLIQLYELTPSHQYFQLSWYLARASYVGDRSRRHLLVPGLLQELYFTSGRLTSRLFARGSRLVVLIAAVRQPNIEINYGTG